MIFKLSYCVPQIPKHLYLCITCMEYKWGVFNNVSHRLTSIVVKVSGVLIL